jgi:ABC-2 type transport system ATP-binding protein
MSISSVAILSRAIRPQPCRPGGGGKGIAPGAGLLTVTGLESSRIGQLAASASIVLYELTPLTSLEGAFMELTPGSVEFGVPG